jgi:hypothetical protein
MICNRCKVSNPEVAQFCCNCAFPLGSTNQASAENKGAQYVEYGSVAKSQTGASGRAITSMILSIASLVLCCTFLGVPGMILGKMEMNEIKAGRAPQAGDGFAKTAFYLGIAGTALSLLGTAFYLVVLLTNGSMFRF